MKENNRKAIARRARQRKQRARRVALTLCLIVATMLVSVGGTLAWLTDKTDSVVNTFTVGDINIDLTETTTSYKIVPGVDIEKDPKVTVEANSEACYLFVKIEEANWPTAAETDGTRKVEYAIAAGWTALGDDYPGVYYRTVAASTAAQDFEVLLNNKVTVRDTLTKTEANEITVRPTLTFTAYAVQQAEVASAAAAWAIANPTT